MKQLISLVEGDKHDAFYQLAITTGMRQGELFDLHRDAINLNERKLVARRQATEVWSNVRVKPPKTKASYRTIDLTDTVVQKLRPTSRNWIRPATQGRSHFQILGHSSPAVTLKIYAHVLPGLEGQARDRVADVWLEHLF